jgi:hypothetical protein
MKMTVEVEVVAFFVLQDARGAASAELTHPPALTAEACLPSPATYLVVLLAGPNGGVDRSPLGCGKPGLADEAEIRVGGEDWGPGRGRGCQGGPGGLGSQPTKVETGAEREQCPAGDASLTGTGDGGEGWPVGAEAGVARRRRRLGLVAAGWNTVTEGDDGSGDSEVKEGHSEEEEEEEEDTSTVFCQLAAVFATERRFRFAVMDPVSCSSGTSIAVVPCAHFLGWHTDLPGHPFH